MKKSNKSQRMAKRFWRIMITATGIMLIAFALGDLVLGICGNTAAAVVIPRRIEGRIDGAPPNVSYKWSIDYTYWVDGKQYSGSHTYKGSAISVNYDTTVHYLPIAPCISSLNAAPMPNFSTAVSIAFGIFLIYAVNAKGKKKKAFSKKAVSS
ncbi:MAG: hypothetical protein AB7D36_03975 [Oscillospiraceae bacterium]